MVNRVLDKEISESVRSLRPIRRLCHLLPHRSELSDLLTCPAPTPDSVDRMSTSQVIDQMRLSYSSISTYETCPAKFKFQSEDRVPTSSSAGLSFGDSLYQALHRFPTPDPPLLQQPLDVRNVPAQVQVPVRGPRAHIALRSALVR